jgi:hypothetical protein
MEVVGKFYSQLVNFPAIWYILCPFGKIFPVSIYFYTYWYVDSKTIWQPRLHLSGRAPPAFTPFH